MHLKAATASALKRAICYALVRRCWALGFDVCLEGYENGFCKAARIFLCFLRHLAEVEGAC